MIVRWLIFSLLSTHAFANHHVAICTMFKNEAPWLKEWVAYHHDVLGVDHFYLYNNESTDNFLEVLDPYIQKGVVEVIDWPSIEAHALHGYDDCLWVPYQVGAINDCLRKRALGKCRWVAVIDVDEFIVPVHGIHSFANLLSHAERTKVGTIIINWVIFGTSHLQDLAPDELLTEKLTQRAPLKYAWNDLTKGIHRPEAITTFTVHGANIKPEYRSEHTTKDKFRIHHYWTRTENALLEKRKPSEEQLAYFDETFNQENDDVMTQYLPSLRKALSPCKEESISFFQRFKNFAKRKFLYQMPW